MPLLVYFAAIGPALLGLLLAVSAYLEPQKAANPAEFFGISPASAESRAAPQKPADEDDLFDRLRVRPLT